MKPILPKDLIEKSVEILGPEMSSDNFNETRNKAWRKVESDFNNSNFNKATIFITGKVIGAPKFFKNGAVLFQIKDVEGNGINVYSHNKNNIKNYVQSGSVVGVKGRYQMYRNPNFSDDCTLQFLANEITNLKMIRQDIKPLAEFIGIHKPKKKIKFLGKKKIRIALITSEGSEAREDIRKSLNKYFDLHEHFVNLFNHEDISEKIRQLSGADYEIIMLSRGGTEKLEVFNNYELLNALFQSEKMIITALGHASFKSLSDLVADYSFDTPSAGALNLSNMRREYEQKRNYLVLGAVVLLSFGYLVSLILR